MKTAVLLATYNAGEYLAPMLDSLMEQTFSDFVVYIHDDGSTDDTVSVIREYKTNYPGRFKRVKDKRHRGAKGSFFYMMKKIEADLYFFADDDDVWFPEKMEILYQKITEIPPDEPTAVFSDMQVTDADLGILHKSFIRTLDRCGNRIDYPQILIDNPAAGCAMCINRALRDLAIAPQVNRSHVSMHDKWVLTLASIFGTIVFVDEPLVYYRQHGSNVMGARSESRGRKVVRNLMDLATGRFREKKRDFLAESKRMAWELLTYSQLPRDVRHVLRNYVMISQKNKLARVHFYRKYGFNRLKGTLWMYLWV